MRETKECLSSSLGGLGQGIYSHVQKTIIPFVKLLIFSSSSPGIRCNVLKIKQE